MTHVVGDHSVNVHVLLLPLDHAMTALAHAKDEIENLGCFPCVKKAYSLMDGDEGSNAAYASRAVSNNRFLPTCARPEIICNLDQIDDLLGARGNAKVWPTRVVEVINVAMLYAVADPEEPALDVVESSRMYELYRKQTETDLLSDG